MRRASGPAVNSGSPGGRVVVRGEKGASPTLEPPRVCVCILNWNGWADTLECLESVLRSNYPAFQVVVVDNGSDDDSVERIRAWAAGAATPDPKSHRLAHLSAPALPKPIPLREHASDGRGNDEASAGDPAGLVLLRSEQNLGFAGGMNLGLRHALRRGFAYVWLLNNDTVVEPNALGELVAEMLRRPRLGLVGSTLVFYDRPDTVQALGGFAYNRWLGLSRQLGQGRVLDAAAEDLQRSVERRMYGVQGASVLTSGAFLERVGLLSEDYFLYFEEQDWAERARRAGFGVGYAVRSVVYHKEGRSTGNHGLRKRERSESADFYQIQARLIFTRKFHPFALPTVYLGLLGVVFNRLRRRQYGRIRMLAELALRTLGRRGGPLHPGGLEPERARAAESAECQPLRG